MSYEEISKDVFTGGAEGRYTKAKAPVADAAEKKTEKKKKAPKIEAEVKPADEATAETTETTEKPKTKKKARAPEEKSAEPAVTETNGDASVKPKKKRAPKIEENVENIDPVVVAEVPATTEEPVKKKKARAPKASAATEETPSSDPPAVNAYEEPIGEVVAPKVKRAKKPKSTAAAAATSDNVEMTANGSETMNYGGIDVNPAMNDGFLMGTAEIPMETKQQSEYEQAITDAFNNLASKINFTEYVGGDVWSIIHPPKTARLPNRSGIRKIMAGPSSRQDPRMPNGRGSLTQPATKGGFFNRMKSTVTTLVRDENNLIFGEKSNYDVAYIEEEEDGVDTDDLHRYAQKLRELEDADREVNPDVIVIRGGKTVFGVQEEDAEGNTILSKRKPIYDRAADQEIDGGEDTGKKKLLGLGRIRNVFSKAKDRDGKGENSPKSSTGTPDSNEKRSKRKSTKKQNDENAMAVTPGIDATDY